MGKSCAIIPRVRNRKGEIVESKLFKSLLSFTNNNRSDAVKLYLITKNSEFIRNWNPKLTLDDNNEPTISSLLKKTNISQVIPEENIIERLNRDIGYYKKGTDKEDLVSNTSSNYESLVQKAINFNRNSEFRDDYVAMLTTKSVDNKTVIGVHIERKTKSNSDIARRMEYNYNLNRRLKDILIAKGVPVGALTELERRLGVNGVTEFNTAKEAANGIVAAIRLAEGIKGEEALPEEFAHFAIKAMYNHPLIQRLLTLIKNNNLTAEILGDDLERYETLYKGDKSKLAEEAAGKLLAKHLLNGEEIPAKPYRNLLERVIAAVKSFFRSLGADQIQNAMYEADREMGTLAKNILSGKMDKEFNIQNISSSELFYQTTNRVNRDKKLLQNIIDNELKRLKIYQKRANSQSFEVSQVAFIQQLESSLANDQDIEGIYSFLEKALATLGALDSRLHTILNDTSSNLNSKAKVLRDIRNYYFSYKTIVDEIRAAMIDDDINSTNRYDARVKVALDNTTLLLNNLWINYNRSAKPLFIEFIKPFFGESLIVPWGKHKGKEFSVEKLVEVAEKDISFFDRWLDSAADSSDYMIKLIDQAVKKSKERARHRTLELIKKIAALQVKLEQAGIKDTKWMFERDAYGKLTGKYIRKYDYIKYYAAMNTMLEELKKKYGENPVGRDAENFKIERSKWFNENTEPVEGKRVPKKSLYKGAYWDLSTAQRDYYDAMMAIKEELEEYLPEGYTKCENIIKIRKDLLERVKSSDGLKSGMKEIQEAIKDAFIERTDDTDLGTKATLMDFENHQVQSLPIYYTRLKEGESMDDMSTDVTSTMIAYAAMAIDFDEMNKVIDVLEIGRDLMRERKVEQTSGENTLKETLDVLGRKVERVLTKKGDETRFMQRLNDYFEMQVYQRYIADQGHWGKISIAKSADALNALTALNGLALNIIAGISNVETGKVMMRIEYLAKEFFTIGDTWKADNIYRSALPEYLGEIGKRVKTSKLALWIEFFNVLQDFEEEVKDTNFDRKTRFSKLFGKNTLFFINHAGEHWMQTRTSLALANAYKMKAPDGSIVSLWDAMEPVYIDENNKALGAKLKLKDGYTKEDGSEFTEEDVYAFTRKSAAINQKMHGIYNKIDRAAFQRLAQGRMASMFRKWIKPSLNRRFKGLTYNFDMQSWTEGYYLSCGRFLNQIRKDLLRMEFHWIARFNELSKGEKANVRRALTELGSFLAVLLALGVIHWDDDDKKKRPWLMKMFELQLRRLKTETGSLTFGPSMLTEGFKILRSPAAGIKTAEDLVGIIDFINPLNMFDSDFYTDELKSGRYKGHSEAYKTIMESIPMNRTIYRGLHPENSIPFYKGNSIY